MFSKLKTLNLIILILTLFSILLIAAPAELHVVGNQLETISGGCPVRLVGVDIDGLEWSPAGYGPPNGNAGNIQQSVAGAVNTWHANFVRIPVSQDFWFGYGNSHGTPASASAYQQFIMNAVTEATSLGCYVEIDLHWSGTGSFGTSVNQESMPDDNSTAFWQAVATAYSGYTNVFFDLYNEPINDTWAIWKGGGQSVSGFHTPGFQALVKTIRDTGAKNIIVIGGLSYSWDMTGISANSITDTNTAGTMSGDGIMYEAHIYDNKGGSSEAAKIALWNQYVAPAVNAGFCVDIGEFGSATDGSEDSSGCTPFETDLVSWINGNNTAAAGGKSYVFNAMAWDFNTTASPVLLTDWSFDPTSCHGVTVKNWLAAITPVTCGATTPTFTLTLTRTPTKTFTPTSTKTFTLTSTLTYTQTVPSATPSFTRTFTPTFTGTYTSTVPSATPSFTRTFTPTFTGTYTSTVPSATPSFTRTFTPTFTGTYTSTVPSATPSFTRTFTPTFTVTLTSTVSSLTPTFTMSSTESFTATGTFTPTDIVTNSATPTVTVTPLNPTATFTGTNTAIAPSATFTVTAQNTATAVNTQSPTPQPPSATNTAVLPSPTVTQTSSETQVPTLANTATFTYTPSAVPPTSTYTFSPTYTFSYTQTPTPLPTFTYTWTQANTATAVPTATWTFTATPTPSYTDTQTPVLTATPGLTPGIFKPILYFNQNSTYMNVEMSVPVAASQIEVIVYTKAFRKVLDTKFETGLTYPKMNLTMMPDITSNFANGVYYYVVIYTDVNGKTTRSKINAFIVQK